VQPPWIDPIALSVLGLVLALLGCAAFALSLVRRRARAWPPVLAALALAGAALLLAQAHRLEDELQRELARTDSALHGEGEPAERSGPPGRGP
jgi:hypothetical protein